MKYAFLALALLGFQAKAATIGDALTGYREVAHALAYDKLAETTAKANALVATVQTLIDAGSADANLRKMLDGAKAVAAAGDEDSLRLQMSKLSEGAVWLVKNSPALHGSWQLYKCPMVAAGAFPYWIQPVGEKMANPYMGTSMLACGVRRAWNKFP